MSKKFVIAFDLDNTLCAHIRRNHPEDILKVEPYEKIVNILRELKKRGHKIIIWTRRDACGKNARKLTKQWLKKHKIPYDKLVTNKIHYDIFIGDRLLAYLFTPINPNIVEINTNFICKHIREHTYKPKRRKK